MLRVEFNQHFNGRIPSFDFYTDFSPGLEIYQTALARIEALWPSPKVLEVIEESIFKKPDANTEAFNLEAYRELLLLYAVAKEIISPEISGRGELLNLNIEDFGPGAKDANSSKFQATPIQPLSAIVAGDKERESQMLQALVVLPPLPRLNPDIDITRLVSQSVGLTSKPESDSQFFAQFSASTIEDHAVASLVLTTELPQVKGAGNFLDFDPFEPAVEANDKLNRPVF